MKQKCLRKCYDHYMMDVIQKILETAVYAPSGDNSQPWRFEVEKNSIFVFNLSERDIPFYNYEQKGSYVAHGALIENIKVLASAQGFKTNIKLFNDNTKKDLVAVIDLVQDNNIVADNLHKVVALTCTNRKPYEDRELTNEQVDYFVRSSTEVEEGDVKLVTDKELKKQLGLFSSVNEKIVLTTPKLHKIFFDHLVWTEKEEREKKTGLFLKTLELSPPQQIAFRLIRNWKIMKLLNFFGLYKMVANENAEIYAESSALGAVVMKDSSRESFVNAGRLVQRVWLKTTLSSMSFHPITGVLFLAQRALFGDTEGLVDTQVEMIKQSYEGIKGIFEVGDGTVAMMFRIGYSGKPSAKSSRMMPQIIFR